MLFVSRGILGEKMELKHHLRDYSTYIGIVLVQIVLIGAGLVLLTSGARKEAITTYTAPTKEISEAPKAKPQVTGTSTERQLIVNLNTGTQEELELLPGVGEATALKIIEYREKNGPFKKIEDVMDVSGIGEKKFEDMKNNLAI